MFSLSMDERGRSANDEGDGAQEVFLDRLGVPRTPDGDDDALRAPVQASDTGVMGFELALSSHSRSSTGTSSHRSAGRNAPTTQAGIRTAQNSTSRSTTASTHAARLAVNWSPRLPRQRRRSRSSSTTTRRATTASAPRSVSTAREHREPARRTRRSRVQHGRKDAGAASPSSPDSRANSLDDRWVAPEGTSASKRRRREPRAVRRLVRGPRRPIQGKSARNGATRRPSAFAIPGVEFGNVLVTVPAAAWLQDGPFEGVPRLGPAAAHDYVAFYAWLRECLRGGRSRPPQDAQEPQMASGKTVGLNAERARPAVDDLPNVYPYIVNNPGEGAGQASVVRRYRRLPHASDAERRRVRGTRRTSRNSRASICETGMEDARSG